MQIATELGARPAQVKSAVELLDGGASVPFIARYRKEATDGLDDNQLRELEVRLAYLRELQERRGAVLKSIDEQGKLTPQLRAAIEAAATKQVLEDLYLPYKPKRRSKGAIAREAGIEPLADRLFADPALDPVAEAAAFVNAEAGFADAAGGAGRRARHPVRALGRGRRAGGPAARLAVGRRPAARTADAGQGRERRRGGEVPRLLRFRRGHPQRAFAPRAGGVPRPLAGHPRSAAWRCPTKDSAASVSAAEGRIAQHLGWRHAGRAADDLLRKTASPGPGRSSSA